MVFNSYIFILAFLPICLIGYFMWNHNERQKEAKVWLFIMSLIFYGYFCWPYVFLILGSIAFNYGCYRFLRRAVSKKKRILTAGIIGNLGLLFVFKYFNFFMDNLNLLFKTDYSFAQILLPLGISFFTFQQIGFLADAYKEDGEPYGFLDYALFIAFYPQLVAGPIVSYQELIPQFRNPDNKRFCPDNFAKGCTCFILGLAKKVLIADVFAKAVDFGYANPESLNSVTAALVAVGYTIQLYFDFSGYSDMARGLGWMLNINLPVNFDSPYKEIHIVGFWKKWHMTLTRFFTRYLYIPMGGNRKGTIRKYWNYWLVFLISGFWHGADWSFVVWGVLHGTAYVAVKMIMDWEKKYPLTKVWTPVKWVGKLISWNVNFIFLVLAWIYFRADSISQANLILGKIAELNMEGGVAVKFAECFQTDEFWYVLKVLHLDDFSFSKLILCFAYFVVAFILLVFCKNLNTYMKNWKPHVLSAVISAVLLLWCILSFSEVTTFIYYNF